MADNNVYSNCSNSQSLAAKGVKSVLSRSYTASAGYGSLGFGRSALRAAENPLEAALAKGIAKAKNEVDEFLLQHKQRLSNLAQRWRQLEQSVTAVVNSISISSAGQVGTPSTTLARDVCTTTGIFAGTSLHYPNLCRGYNID